MQSAKKFRRMHRSLKVASWLEYYLVKENQRPVSHPPLSSLRHQTDFSLKYDLWAERSGTHGTLTDTDVFASWVTRNDCSVEVSRVNNWVWINRQRNIVCYMDDGSGWHRVFGQTRRGRYFPCRVIKSTWAPDQPTAVPLFLLPALPLQSLSLSWRTTW